ncbi:MAG: methyl-accepting chemotaxis protein [Lachnospiraceae bacterium]|nr:methyl-accepting chemotaxis protein [Lachnospiraceae bacterium]
MKRTNNNSISSIKTQICLLVDFAVILAGILMMVLYSPKAKSEIQTLTENYIRDLAEAYGETLDSQIRSADGKTTSILNTDNLSLKLEGGGMEGVESSYVYVVGKSGNMLYHPNGDKIGKSVENEVVKQICADLQAGKTVENDVISYEFGGKMKYASVYISNYTEFVLVVTADQDEVLEPISYMNKVGVAGIIIVAVVFAIFGFFRASMIVKPIRHMTDFAFKLSEMDFTEDEMQAELNKSKNEIGDMSRAITVLRSELVEMVQKIKGQSGVLMIAADDLTNSAAETSNTMGQVESAVNEIAQGATSQAEETQAATENVVTIGSMIEDTSDVVNELVEHAGRMKESSKHAKSILNELDQVNKKTEKYIDVIAKQTDTTNESARKISQAASMITEIAEETNLLSLNASIEAARAGEQGRGFAVVASQIQKLAEQSNESAKEIGDIIEVLLQDSEKAVEIMADVRSSMKEQSEHVERTDEAFGEIQNEIESSIDGMNLISEKTRNMDDARSKVVDGVQSLTAIAQENAASTEETSASVTEVSAIVSGISEKSGELRKVAQELENSMSMFKI